MTWVKTKDQFPPENELVLGDDGGGGVYLVTFCGEFWRYSHYESKSGPTYWCPIPKRVEIESNDQRQDPDPTA